PERVCQVRVGELAPAVLVLTVDDRTDAEAPDGVAEALGSELTGAVEHTRRDFAKPLVVGVLGPEVYDRPDDEHGGDPAAQAIAHHRPHVRLSVPSVARRALRAHHPNPGGRILATSAGERK